MLEIDDEAGSTLCCPKCKNAMPELTETLRQRALESNRTRIGKYDQVREIARGGMGIVYEAVDPDLKRVVAIKVIKNLEPDEKVVGRFYREAVLSAHLRHPNVVSVHEIGLAHDQITQEPMHYIVMDFVSGGTLESTRSRLSLRERIEVLEQISRAIGHAHEHKVIHRDLKPGNVLLSEDGVPKVTDFGLARSEEDSTRLTRSGAVIGTPKYMSPEQVLGRTGGAGAARASACAAPPRQPRRGSWTPFASCTRS